MLARDEFLLHAMRRFFRQIHLLEQGDKIVAAVSGGIDSMVMLDALVALRDELKLEIAVAHVNHRLRGAESDGDEEFVRRISENHGLSCHIRRVDTRALAESGRLSIQEAARNARYEFFAEILNSSGFQKIATAHHADDNAETILLNLIRGAGVKGLSGIPAKRPDEGIIRPLLFATRKQIQEYAGERKLAYREDSSNRGDDYARNYIRHRLLPQIQEYINPNVSGVLNRTAQLFEDLQHYLESEAARIAPSVVREQTEDQVRVDLNELHSKPVFLQEYLLFKTAREFCKTQIDFGAVRLMLQVSQAETGSSCSVSKNEIAYRNRDELLLKRAEGTARFCYRAESEKSYSFDHFSFASERVTRPEPVDNSNVEFIDADTVGKDFLIRSWHNGDWFIPLGMKEKKKLSNFFIDQKIPLFEKDRVPILESAGNIVWICGKRLDDRYKITEKTINVLKLEFLARYHPH